MNLGEIKFDNALKYTIYSERYLNDSKGRFEDYSEVSAQYDPQGKQPYINLPFTILPPERCVILQSSPKKELLEWVKRKEGFRFFWHPDVSRRGVEINGTV